MMLQREGRLNGLRARDLLLQVKDKDNKNEKAKQDHPEAPGVVIGMNDERGGVSFFSS
jgi:hypothetical protein